MAWPWSAMYVSRSSLYCIRYFIGSHWSWIKMGVIWSTFVTWLISLAAAFCTHWSRSIWYFWWGWWLYQSSTTSKMSKEHHHGNTPNFVFSEWTSFHLHHRNVIIKVNETIVFAMVKKYLYNHVYYTALYMKAHSCFCTLFLGNGYLWVSVFMALQAERQSWNHCRMLVWMLN